MKIYFFIILMILFSGICFGQSKEKRSILILSVNFSATTIISVPCESFASSFGDRIKTSEIYSMDSLNMLEQFIKTIRFSKQQIDIDTRAKIIYKSKMGKENIICTDGSKLCINGGVIKKNKLFLKFVLSLIPKKQQEYQKVVGQSATDCSVSHYLGSN